MFNSKKTNDIFYIKSGTTPNTVNKDFYEKEEVNWLNSGDFHNSLIYKTNKKISFEAKKQSNLKEFKVNSIVIAMYGANVGEVGLLKIKTTVNQACAVLSPKKKINSHYYYYYFISHKNKFIAQANGGGQANINQQIISNTYIPYPHFEQQTAIANFLDHQTSKIDKEISLLEKKVELLDELKQSTIYEAVTKGLNPDVKMKDSGIEWIGMIPEHWEVKRVKDLFKIGRGRVISVSEVEPEQNSNYLYPVYSAATENNGIIGFIDTYDFNKNLLTWTTDGANAGTVFIREGKFNCTNVCGTLIAKNSNKNNLLFQKYSLEVQTPHYKRSDINGAKIMNNEMGKIILVIPANEKEQIEIISFLNLKIKKFECTGILLTKKIKLLKEYKKSLIYEAVTGKIDIGQQQ